MAYTILLSKDTAPLQHLVLGRAQLDASSPSVALATRGREALLYSLVGRITVYANGVCLGTLGGRRSVTEHRVQCVRFPSGVDFAVTLVLDGFAADLLWMTCARQAAPFVAVPETFGPQAQSYPPVIQGATTASHLAPASRVPYMHGGLDVYWHTVGHGTHERTVAEVPRVEGYELDVGETMNLPGAWSSYPPHANAEDIEKFGNGQTTWEEIFYCVCEKPGVIVLNGLYTDGSVVNKLQAVQNGEAYVVPLGSHPLVAHPSSFLWYFWAYCGTALEKQYKKYSDDVLTYRK